MLYYEGIYSLAPGKDSFVCLRAFESITLPAPCILTLQQLHLLIYTTQLLAGLALAF